MDLDILLSVLILAETMHNAAMYIWRLPPNTIQQRRLCLHMLLLPMRLLGSSSMCKQRRRCCMVLLLVNFTDVYTTWHSAELLLCRLDPAAREAY